MEDDPIWHKRVPDEVQYFQAIKELTE